MKAANYYHLPFPTGTRDEMRLPLRPLPNGNHLLDFHGALVPLLEGESYATPRVQVRADARLLQPRGAEGETEEKK